MDIDYHFLAQTIQNAIALGIQDGFAGKEAEPVVTVNVPPLISMRDFFAGCALCGVLAAEAGVQKITFPESGKRSQFCFDEADAMLAAREADHG